MTILSALYKLLIGPLELFFEVVFSLANRFVPNPGLAIIFLSLAMNFLVLPLYRRADLLQAQQRDQEAKMSTWVSHIKKTFSGDERFMMLQTYYRQNDYSPFHALRGSVSLLLEIPFFIAAYQFLSNLQLLQGVQFGPIADLGQPDKLIHIAGLSLNLLPILMTVINFISAAIYMKGFPFKSKLQMYAIALVFLVFLYNSPAGLVFYWTLNNVFSLLKNIFYKLKNPGKVLNICASAVGLALVVGLLVIGSPLSVKKKILVLVVALLLQAPLIFSILSRKYSGRKTDIPHVPGLFICSSLFLALLTGVMIPSAVIKASPIEFINYLAYKSPLWFVFDAALLGIGTFVIWMGIFYRLSDTKGKNIFGLLTFLLSGIAAADYMFFGTKYGNISYTLKYDIYPAVTGKECLINIVVILSVSVLLFLLWKKNSAVSRVVSLSLLLAAAGMSVINTSAIHNETSGMMKSVYAENSAVFDSPDITLSRSGKNVVVFMLDRALGAFEPYIFEERPELKEKFDGFTYYPNTVSFGSNTKTGASALFGGYEYTPEMLNARKDELLADKHDEALKVLPVLFHDNGYDVTVCDPPYAGYQWLPDLSIYNEYPDIHRYVTKGKFQLEGMYTEEIKNYGLDRNFFCYSIFRISPVIAHGTLYNNGYYNSADPMSGRGGVQLTDGLSVAFGTNPEIIDSYAIMSGLSSITEISDSQKGSFLMMCNDITHSPTILQEPDYEVSMNVDNTEYDSEHITRISPDGKTLELNDDYFLGHYHVNMAGMIKLGEWFDYLRDIGVYDNTRIILVADHGYDYFRDVHQLINGDLPDESAAFKPLFMVKDFNSTGFTVDDSFMTNADVPYLASNGLLDPVNPFSGNSLDGVEFKKQDMLLAYSIGSDTSGTQFDIISSFVLSGPCDDANNWHKIN